MPIGMSLPDRQTLRLKWYDYHRAGFYFVTICTAKRQHAFGYILQGTMHLNDAGEIAWGVWTSLPERFAGLSLDQFVIMPNHMHGIIVLHPYRNIENMPQQFQLHMQSLAHERHVQDQRTPSLGEVVRTFKAASARLIRVGGHPEFSWQKNYWSSVMKDEQALMNVRNYIKNNPRQWSQDKLYTEDAL